MSSPNRPWLNTGRESGTDQSWGLQPILHDAPARWQDGWRAGQKKAREMWFLARLYDAQQALDMGLVNTVVPLERLEEETLVWCAISDLRTYA